MSPSRRKHPQPASDPRPTALPTAPPTVRPTVLVDVGPAVHQHAGLSRYAHELAAAMLANAPTDLDIALFYNRHSGHTLPADLSSAPHITLTLGQYGWRLGALAGQLLRWSQPPVMQTARRELSRAPRLYHATEHLLPYLSIPAILTVHDLIFESLPAYHTRLNRTFLRLAMPRFLAAATAIIAVSAHTAHDIVARYHVDTRKIHVIHEGVDAHFQPASAAEKARVHARYADNAPYLLMVGTLEPRKNHATALRALQKLRAAGRPHKLVIAGGQGWLFDSIQALVTELGLEDAVIFTGYVPAADLPALYSAADCFLLPSLYEGFGFPVLEAMACGTPVVCSNVSSLPEIAGDAARLVPPQDADALATAVGEILDHPRLAETLRRHGLANAARFRWDACAAATLDVYRATLAEKSPRPI
ncbi:MAG: glycosyltransferase family 1 protein [Litorilinea sp.]